jgi:hypothetical protein
MTSGAAGLSPSADPLSPTGPADLGDKKRNANRFRSAIRKPRHARESKAQARQRNVWIKCVDKSHASIGADRKTNSRAVRCNEALHLGRPSRSYPPSPARVRLPFARVLMRATARLSPVAGEIANLAQGRGGGAAPAQDRLGDSCEATPPSPRSTRSRHERIRKSNSQIAKRRLKNQLQRKTPAKRHIVTRGGQLRSIEDSALGMPSMVLDFVIGCRCQVADTALQPGGVIVVWTSSTWLVTG